MFKFKIDYFAKADENGADSEREATVFAENLSKAKEKIEAMDPEYDGVCSVSAKEYPHWKSEG